VGYVARIGEGIGANRALVGIPDGKRILERYKHEWDANIKTILQVVGWRHTRFMIGTGGGLL